MATCVGRDAVFSLVIFHNITDVFNQKIGLFTVCFLFAYAQALADRKKRAAQEKTQLEQELEEMKLQNEVCSPPFDATEQL